jgi:hypothetical protein
LAHFLEQGIAINLNCEDFYEDFKTACEEVISMTIFNSNKMNLPLLYVPSTELNNTITYVGSPFLV